MRTDNPSPSDYRYGARWCLCIALMWVGGIFGLWFYGKQWWFCSIPIGVAMLGSAIALHECAHGSLFRSHNTNKFLGLFFGMCSFQPFHSYQYAHHQHHRWQGTNLDPTPSPLKPPRPNRILDLLLWSQLPILYWGGVWWPYFRCRIPHKAIWHKLADLTAVLIPHLLLGFVLPEYLYACGVGFILYSVGYERFFTLNQHMGLRPQQKKERYTPTEQIMTARTIPLSWSRILLNFTYHKEHHRYPNAHWSLLPDIHKRLKQEHPDFYSNQNESLAPIQRRSGRLHEILWPSDDEMEHT